MAEFRILLIDDEESQLASLKSFLKRRKYMVKTASSGEQGVEIVKSEEVDLIFTDFRMGGMNGLAVVKEVKKINPEILIAVITAFSATEEAVEVMKAGAFDYLAKPINLDELELLVEKAKEHTHLVSENKLLREQLESKYRFKTIITQNSKMEDVINTAGRVAKSKSTILIRGESGTGKELIGKAIHYSSNRKDRSLITVNCAALTESLLESELFGHEKGAFTGAVSQRKGRFEQADGGTLFLDEVGDIPLQTQVKLLRALQFGEFERVGGTQTLKVDVRVITATNRNLEELIQQGLFREDLFYRINVISITIPPLRERKSDIPILIQYFIDQYAKENEKAVGGISKEAQNILMRYHFPGNIRELENIIERAVVLTRENIITTNDLPSVINSAGNKEILDPYNFSDIYVDKVAAFETTMIKEALDVKQGNQSQAAKLIGISERHLRSRMQKLNIINHKR